MTVIELDPVLRDKNQTNPFATYCETNGLKFFIILCTDNYPNRRRSIVGSPQEQASPKAQALKIGVRGHALRVEMFGF